MKSSLLANSVIFNPSSVLLICTVPILDQLNLNLHCIGQSSEMTADLLKSVYRSSDTHTHTHTHTHSCLKFPEAFFCLRQACCLA